jgi:hypothetical protein
MRICVPMCEVLRASEFAKGYALGSEWHRLEASPPRMTLQTPPSSTVEVHCTLACGASSLSFDTPRTLLALHKGYIPEGLTGVQYFMILHPVHRFRLAPSPAPKQLEQYPSRWARESAATWGFTEKITSPKKFSQQPNLSLKK